jgi:DMSO reductase iron-sulfur subunit
MSLPLLEQVSPQGARYRLGNTQGLVQIGAPDRIPLSKPGPGEQYRFHFDMTKCIGCKCCEVACNEQNNNPANIRWRRVGEIEAGGYPYTTRLHLSMGCNHCLDAACLKGCPVDAYTKDSDTGLVLHSADACIGCQYCTWNCPYGVPRYNEERGVVGKCDMCYGRLNEGREPACVHACPEGAIRVEIVNIGEWRAANAELANAPGLPPAEATLSTTRITMPENLPDTFEKADHYRVRLEHPHWPLVFMLVLTQLSVGALLTIAALASGAAAPLAAAAALAVGHLALVASTAHLGRPIHAYRALKMWKRSWLSREVLSFTAFAGAATAYAGALWLGSPWAPLAGAVTALAGIIGIYCSASIYLVPARPAWNSSTTTAEFYLTAAITGPLFAWCFLGEAMAPAGQWLAPAAAAAQVIAAVSKLVRLMGSEEFELRQSARLLTADLKNLFLVRLVVLAAAGVLPVLGAAVPVAGGGLPWIVAALVLALGAEILGRYLFFVSVVPRNVAASFFGGREAA